MAQSRVVLRGDRLDEANRILAETHIGSLSELMSILITRYGSHLIETWVMGDEAIALPPAPHPQPSGGAPTKVRSGFDDDFI